MDIDMMSAEELLQWAWSETSGSMAMVTSFQAEGMVLLDMAARVCPGVRVLTVDTGRLPEATHRMMETVRERYGVRVEVAAPEPEEVEAMVEQHGPNLFYRDVALRMLCCQVRKVRPLERKLAGFRGWATGLRRDQTEAREGVDRVSVEDGRLKVSPLADWSKADVEEYSRRHRVPRHPLYDEGYRSIGCGPCTRPVSAGDEERAGRWWWEVGVQKECGIHFSADGRLERKLDVLIGDLLNSAAA